MILKNIENILHSTKFRKWLIYLGILSILFVPTFPFIYYSTLRSDEYMFAKKLIKMSDMVIRELKEVKDDKIWLLSSSLKSTKEIEMAGFYLFTIGKNNNRAIIKVYLEKKKNEQWQIKELKIFPLIKQYLLFAMFIFTCDILFIIILIIQYKKNKIEHNKLLPVIPRLILFFYIIQQLSILITIISFYFLRKYKIQLKDVNNVNIKVFLWESFFASIIGTLSYIWI